MKIPSSLEKAKNIFLETVHHGKDILYIDFVAMKSVNATIFFIDGMVNKETVNRFVLQPLVAATHADEPVTCHYLLENVTANAENSIIETMEDCLDTVLGGDALLLVDGQSAAVKIGAKGYSMRSVSEPPTATVIKGPREGFTEDVKTNSILLRRKLKSPDLVFEMLKVGKYSNTNVFVAYLEGVADSEIVNKVLSRIKAIDIDGVLDSSYVEKFLDERKHSIFKQVGNTEKPDILASRLLEGRVAVFVDGSPIVLTVPYMLLEDFQSAQDYYDRAFRATFSRLLRLLGIFVAVLLPAVYVSAQVFHLQIIPLRFLTKIMGSMREIPLPPALEMLLVLLLFEVLREASVRMPKYVGTALSVVGGLVLGDTAVRAGIISTPSILIMALSGIAIYTVPEQEGTTSVLRLLFLVLAGSLGMFGILLGGVFLMAYLVSLSGYGTPYLAPFAPLVPGDLKDGFFKSPLVDMKKRPRSIRHRNNTRLKTGPDAPQ